MANVFEELAGLDKLLHEPARLSIMSALAACQSADFLALQRLTGMTGGNLSVHLSKLEEAGLITLEKQFVEKRPNTQVQLTEKGRKAIESHWQQLENLRQESKQWKPDESV
jgi:DNA-binding MarR family transcriptional regulator